MQISTDLVDSPAEIIRQLMIQSTGAGVVDGYGYGAANVPAAGVWPIFKSVQPDPTFNQVTIKLTQGVDHGRTMPDGEVASHFGFQLRIRAIDDEVGVAKAFAIRTWAQKGTYQQLVEVFNQDTGKTTLYLIPCLAKIGQVLEIGRDRPGSGMWNCTLNFQSAVRLVVNASPTTLLYDLFDGVSGTLLSAHAMNVGSGWTDVQGGFSIQSDSAVNTSSPNPSFSPVAFANAGQNSGTLNCFITIPSTPLCSCGFAIRGMDDENYGYIVFETDTANVPTILIGALVNGSEVGNTYPANYFPGQRMLVTIIVSGNSYSVSLNGVFFAQATVANFSNSTLFGLAAFTNASQGYGEAVYNEFQMTSAV